MHIPLFQVLLRIIKMSIVVNMVIRGKIVKGVVNCENSRDKGPPEGNSARG